MDGLIRIPQVFFNDHGDRCLPTPEVVKETKAHYWIRKDDPAIAELRSDAEYYADRDGPDCAPAGLKAAAKALLKVLP